MLFPKPLGGQTGPVPKVSKITHYSFKETCSDLKYYTKSQIKAQAGWCVSFTMKAYKDVPL